MAIWTAVYTCLICGGYMSFADHALGKMDVTNPQLEDKSRR